MLPRYQSAAFVAGYATLSWLVVWFNTAVLGLGDVKFGGGYGGQEIYYPLWLIAFVPAALLSSIWHRLLSARCSGVGVGEGVRVGEDEVAVRQEPRLRRAVEGWRSWLLSWKQPSGPATIAVDEGQTRTAS